VGEVIEVACKPPRFAIMPEESYYIGSKKFHGVDWVVSDDTGHLFIEAKTKRLTLGARIRSVNDDLDRDLVTMATAIVGSRFSAAISDMKFCLRIRNCYAHSLWHDANTGNLAFVNLEELAKAPSRVTNLLGLAIRYLDMNILTEQERYLDFVDHSISFLNYEGRYLKGDLASNHVPAPAPQVKPPLYR
jgi:hypothetical protein